VASSLRGPIAATRADQDVLAVGYGAAEWYSVATEKWRVAPTPNGVYAAPSLVPLADNSLLLLDAASRSVGERLKKTAKSWVAVPAPPRSLGVLVALRGGGLLSTGEGETPSSVAMVFDGDTWMEGDGMLTPRADHAVARLGDGRVVVAGGVDSMGQPLSTTELFSPDTGSFVPGPPLSAPRSNAALVRLADDRLLLVGGRDDNGVVAFSEFLDTLATSWSQGPSLVTPREGFHLRTSVRGHVLASLGAGEGGGAVLEAELFTLRDETWSAASASAIVRPPAVQVTLKNGQILSLSEDGATAELFCPPPIPRL